MRTAEDYADDYPADPAGALAAQLVDLGSQLDLDLTDVADDEEARNLRIEHYREAILAWMKGR